MDLQSIQQGFQSWFENVGGFVGIYKCSLWKHFPDETEHALS